MQNLITLFDMNLTEKSVNITRMILHRGRKIERSIIYFNFTKHNRKINNRDNVKI